MWEHVHDVVVDNIRYRVRETGTGSSIICLHGVRWTGQIWNGLARELMQHFRVVAPDLPGHGDSSVSVDGYSFSVLSDQLAGLLDCLSIAQADFVCSSWAGSLGVRFAAKYPERVGRLFLIDGGYFAEQSVPNANWEAMLGGDLPEEALNGFAEYFDFVRADDPQFWNEDIEAAVTDQVRLDASSGRLVPYHGRYRSLGNVGLPERSSLADTVLVLEHPDLISVSYCGKHGCRVPAGAGHGLLISAKL